MIRLITKRDLEMLKNLRKLLTKYLEGETDVEKSEQFIKEHSVYGEFQDDEIHGYISVQLCDQESENFPEALYINELYVLEEFRGQGIGSSLVKTVLDSELTQKYDKVYVTYSESSPKLKKFYSRLGFTEYKQLDSGNYVLVRYNVNLNI